MCWRLFIALAFKRLLAASTPAAGRPDSHSLQSSGQEDSISTTLKSLTHGSSNVWRILLTLFPCSFFPALITAVPEQPDDHAVPGQGAPGRLFGL